MQEGRAIANDPRKAIIDAILSSPEKDAVLARAVVQRLRHGPRIADSLEDIRPAASSPRAEPLGNLDERTPNELRSWSRARGLSTEGSSERIKRRLTHNSYRPKGRGKLIDDDEFTTDSGEENGDGSGWFSDAF